MHASRRGPAHSRRGAQDAGRSLPEHAAQSLHREPDDGQGALDVRGSARREAARALGASEARIIGRHLLPNTMSPLLVRISTDVGYAILYTASLGFIGLGAQEPMPEWGRMAATGRTYLLDQWWYPTLPGLAIFLAVLGFTWVGDALRDWLDPHLSSMRA